MIAVSWKACNELLRRFRPRVHGRVSAFHFGCNFTCSSNLNQIAFADAGTLALLANPCSAVFHEFRPKRIKAALDRFDGMNAAAAIPQEMALRPARFPKSEQMAIADDVLRLERGWRHVKKFRRTDNIVLGEIYVTFHLATARTARLAGETEDGHSSAL